MCLQEFAKAVLIIVNIIFFLAGGALLAVGIWALVDNTSLTNAVAQIPVDDGPLDSVSLIEAAAYLLIALGAVIVIIAFIGCCGAMRSSVVLLGIYIGILVLIIIGEIAIGVLAVIYRNQIEKTVEKKLKEQLSKDYRKGSQIESGGKIEASSNDTEFVMGWDFIQYHLACCGVDDYQDYDSGGVFTVWSEKVKVDGTEEDAKVPLSCCRRKDKDAPKERNDILDLEKCLKGEFGAINPKGCKDDIKKFLEDYSQIIIGVGFGILLLEIVVLIAAIYLCVLARKDR